MIWDLRQKHVQVVNIRRRRCLIRRVRSKDGRQWDWGGSYFDEVITFGGLMALEGQ